MIFSDSFDRERKLYVKISITVTYTCIDIMLPRAYYSKDPFVLTHSSFFRANDFLENNGLKRNYFVSSYSFMVK